MLDSVQVIHFFFFFFKEQSQKCGDVIFRPFDPVTVQLSLDQSNLQHEKIVLKLVCPQVSVI
jgi:exosome complex exonuclease DIS3/RRP44